MTRSLAAAADHAVLLGMLQDHPVHRVPPQGTHFRFGIHGGRASHRGYLHEARQLAHAVRARFGGAPCASRRMVMLARPRSGSTLLVDLLAQVAAMRCDHEVLHFAVTRPTGFMRDLARACPAPAYGCKILSYQLFEVQYLGNHLAFFERLAGLGYRFVHLRRDTFAQSLSLSRAQKTGVYIRRAGQDGQMIEEVRLDPERFRRMLDWNAAMLSYEDALMSGFPHLRVDYETDLAGAEAQQRTVDDICGFIGHPSGPVAARTKRTTAGGASSVVNIDALRQIARDAGHLPPALPDGQASARRAVEGDVATDPVSPGLLRPAIDAEVRRKAARR